MVEAVASPEEVGVAKADAISSQSPLLLLLLSELLAEPSLTSSNFASGHGCLPMIACALVCNFVLNAFVLDRTSQPNVDGRGS